MGGSASDLLGFRRQAGADGRAAASSVREEFDLPCLRAWQEQMAASARPKTSPHSDPLDIPQSTTLEEPPEDIIPGEIPESTAYLSPSRTLSEIPDEVYTCKNLERLELSDNQISDIPRRLCLIDTLTILNLSHNSITELPPYIDGLVNLIEVNLSHNNLVEVAREVGLLPNLKTVDVSHNKELEELPDTLWTWTKQFDIDVSFTKFATMWNMD